MTALIPYLMDQIKTAVRSSPRQTPEERCEVLLRACAAIVVQPPKPTSRPLSLFPVVSADDLVAALAVLVLCARGVEVVWSPPSILQRQAYPLVLRLRLILQAGSIPRGDLTVEWLLEQNALVQDFESAIAPRRLALLVHDHEALLARLHIFRGWRGQDDATVQHHASNRWRQLILDPSTRERFTSAQIDVLLSRIPGHRLRTYSPDMLDSVGRNYARWGPLIHFMAHPTGPETGGLQTRLQDLRDDLANQLRRRWRDTEGDFDSDDAAHEALEKVCALADDPEHGYSFEGDFLGWLVKTGFNILAARSRWLDSGLEADENIAAPEPTPAHGNAGGSSLYEPLCSTGTPSRKPAAPTLAADRDLKTADLALLAFAEDRRSYLRFKRYVYMLAEVSFEDRVAIRVIWMDLLRNGQGPTGRSSTPAQELMRRIKELRPVGADLAENTIYTDRRRLLQRMDAIEYPWLARLLNLPDKCGDASMLVYLERRRGRAGQGSILRGLAAMSRANGWQPEKPAPLADALLAWCLVNRAEPARLLNEWIQFQSGPEELGGELYYKRVWGLFTTHSPMLSALRRTAGVRVSGRVAGFRNASSILGSNGPTPAFYLAPCWLMAALRNQDAATAQRTLLPARDELAWMRYIMDCLQPSTGGQA